MKQNKLYTFNDNLPVHIASFRGRLFVITLESEEDNTIDVLMLDDYSKWCFAYHEFNYYCKEIKIK